MSMTEASPAILSPNTLYFEIGSEIVGDRYGIWVTTPPHYQRNESKAYPVVFVTDGNTNALLMTAATFLLLGDHLRPTTPFIQVCIGFADNDLASRLIRRNRDFVPPGEPVSELSEPHVRVKAFARVLGEEGHKAFMANMRTGGADKFLRFLEEELYPEIALRYRILPDEVGLYGHSQAGLFVLYTLTAESPKFTIFGAGSPGILSRDSQVIERYLTLVSSQDRQRRDTQLHIVANDLEMTGPTALYRAIGAGTLNFIDIVRSNPLPGLAMTTEIITGENHYSGVFDGYRSFLRACFKASTTHS